MHREDRVAELRLTEAERQAGSFLAWDDAALGKLVKQTALQIQDGQGDRAAAIQTACLLLCSELDVQHAKEANYQLDGVTLAGRPLGAFTISVRQAT